jgi:hypothetical protein
MEGRTGHGPLTGPSLITRNDVNRSGVVAVGWRASSQLVDTIVGCIITSGPRRGSGDRFCVLLSCGLILEYRLQVPWPMVGWHATCSGASEQRGAVDNRNPPSTGRILRNAQADGTKRCRRRSWQRWGHCNCCMYSSVPPGVGQHDLLLMWRHGMQVLGPFHRRGSLQAAHSTLQQIDYSVGTSVWAAWPEEYQFDASVTSDARLLHLLTTCPVCCSSTGALRMRVRR